MELIQFAVLLSALFCSLVAGLVLTFAIVVMPGIKTLGDLDFLRSFKAMDLAIGGPRPKPPECRMRDLYTWCSGANGND